MRTVAGGNKDIYSGWRSLTWNHQLLPYYGNFSHLGTVEEKMFAFCFYLGLPTLGSRRTYQLPLDSYQEYQLLLPQLGRQKAVGGQFAQKLSSLSFKQSNIFCSQRWLSEVGSWLDWRLYYIHLCHQIRLTIYVTIYSNNQKCSIAKFY